ADESPAETRGFSLPAAHSEWTLYLRPLGFLNGAVAEAAVGRGAARPLAGGPIAFTACEVALRRSDPSGDTIERVIFDLATLDRWAKSGGEETEARVAERLEALSAPRAPFAGLDLARPRIMGVLNVTPDSFSDGGDFVDRDRAIARGVEMLE